MLITDKWRVLIWKIGFFQSLTYMLIEIIGNSTSLLVIVLIGLSIYFGIQAKKKKKWFLVISMFKKENDNHLRLQKINIYQFLFN